MFPPVEGRESVWLVASVLHAVQYAPFQVNAVLLTKKVESGSVPRGSGKAF